MKVGELVIYTEGNKEFNALVLGERTIPEHTGKNDEPLLTLAFAKERVDAAGIPLPVHGTGQTSELVQIRLDVAHESHEYDLKQQRFYGKKQYDGGRWREVTAAAANDCTELVDALERCRKSNADLIARNERLTAQRDSATKNSVVAPRPSIVPSSTPAASDAQDGQNSEV